jgi:preprotein translocase subunit SecA
MPGRRWSDGLHQAVEAKEGVRIERENQTLATITFQNYFRMYEKLAGMTGTADTEAGEFSQIYSLDVVVVPTNEPMIRDDRSDLVYRTAPEKWNAVVEEIQDCQKHGQPVLVGTVSIENSEMLSRLLKKNRVQHVVLNAKYHEREAAIVAQAGRRGAVTIATNMAGRGTDIVLGGSPEQLARAEVDEAKDPESFAEALARYEELCAAEREEVVAAGGVHILGTERHESRRIDNQLRGRSGRQGDPGSSRFYLSLQDDLMRIFASDRVQALMKRLGMEEGMPIEAGMVNRAIERAQTQVEGRNFEIRKNLLEYDDVMNKQREAIYELRRDILLGREGRDYVTRIAGDVVDYLIDRHCPAKADPRDWQIDELRSEIRVFFDLEEQDLGDPLEELGTEELREAILGAAERSYGEKEEAHGAEALRAAERHHMLRVVDSSWKDHLLALDHLKEGIGLRGYGQRDPKNEYKRESYELFTEMKERIEDTIIKDLFRLRPISAEEIAELERRRRALRPADMSFRHPNALGLPAPPAGSQPGPGPGMPGMPAGGPPSAAPGGFPPPQASGGPPMRPQKPRTVVRSQAKVGRNAPCPCGSGKKYKKCCGAPVAV